MPISYEERVAHYKRRRRILIAALGGRCRRCGETDPTKLEFHHTKPRTWEACSTSSWQRQTLYEKDFEAGVLELLCGYCNKLEGQPEGDSECPF